MVVLPSASLRGSVCRHSVASYSVASKQAMTAVKQSKVTGDLKYNGRKTPTVKAFEVYETDRESYGSSSEDTETDSPKSVVSKVRKWPATLKDVNVDVSSRRVRNQIERIRAEESHLGEDIGECLIAKVSGAVNDSVDVMIFSRPASPLSGKGSGDDQYDSVNTQSNLFEHLKRLSSVCDQNLNKNPFKSSYLP